MRPHCLRLALSLATWGALLLITSPWAAASQPLATPGPTSALSYTATALVPTTARSSPGRGSIVSHISTQAKFYGGSNTFLILGEVRERGRSYLQVLLPQRPNATTAWVAANDFFISSDPYRLVVSIGERRVSIYEHGRLQASTGAVVGKPSTPTPLGLFAISEGVPQPAGSDLGPYVITLTAHSDALATFEGGDGTIGIHGYELLGAPLGTASSHGCIRVPEGFVHRALSLPEGTPVLIQA
jgi:lipoprotein-anchoring transpeptidase ErfK/SrfK